MKIHSFTPNITNYKSKQQIKSFTQNPTDCPVFATQKTQTFTGIPSQANHLLAARTVLPVQLWSKSGEFYGVNIFKTLGKLEMPSFLRYTDYQNGLPGKALMLYDSSAKMIGSADLNFSKWQSCENSPGAYTFIDFLNNHDRQNISGVGSKLIQATIEQSLQTEAKGRVFLDARNITDRTGDSFIFYNKMGFTLVNPQGKGPDLRRYYKQLPSKDIAEIQHLSPDEQMLAIYKKVSERRKCKPEDVCIDFAEKMYLHGDKVENLWLPKIQANPVFNESNKLK